MRLFKTKQKERRRSRSRRALLMVASDEEEESSDRSTFQADFENSILFATSSSSSTSSCCPNIHLQEEEEGEESSPTRRGVSFDLSRNVEYYYDTQHNFDDRSSCRGGRMVLADDPDLQGDEQELEDSSLSYTRRELKGFKHNYKTLCRSHSEYAVISGRVADDFYGTGIMTRRRKQNRSQVKAHIRLVLQLCNTAGCGGAGNNVEKNNKPCYFESSAPLQVQNQTWESAREALQRGIQNAIDAHHVSLSFLENYSTTLEQPYFDEIPLSPAAVQV